MLKINPVKIVIISELSKTMMVMVRYNTNNDPFKPYPVAYNTYSGLKRCSEASEGSPYNPTNRSPQTAVLLFTV
jgi:hypothetical protein